MFTAPSMRTSTTHAILSDIHGNLEALSAVLADVERQGVRAIYNLGDTLGYGPNPVECLDLALEMQMVLLGNFDHAVLFGADGFCETAERSVLWSRAQLDAAKDSPAGRRRAEFLASLPRSHRERDVLYVHGSARNPLNEYVVPEDIYNPRKMERIGAVFDRLCFGGHTHIPGVFLERSRGKWEFLHAEECERGFPVRGRKLICNVGSVGQPRDDDERACYALFDGERISLRRVEYDIEATVRKIYAVPELADFLGDRLREGR
jgi:diadenosine tetraphosphatase ApaH/serine/threonine PP2A family protein phosphatase